MTENETTIAGPEKKKAGRPSNEQLSKENAELKERIAALEAAQPAQPINEVRERRAGENPKAVRRQMGQPRRMDVDRYIDKYPDMKLMLINDVGGDVQNWIDAGASPVPVAESRRTFEGITDRHESQWVRFIGGDDGMGGHFWVYLLMIEHEVYEELKLKPQRERQELIQRAMQGGRDQSDGTQGSLGGPRLPSYAANLPDGGTGISVGQETVQ